MDKKKMRKMLYVYISIILVLVFSSRTIYNFSLPMVTAALPQAGWLIHELEVRGVVEFAETFYILATSGGWIDEILIEPGEKIYTNATVATYSPTSNVTSTDIENLSFTIERTKNQLAALNLNRSAIQNSLQALATGSPADLQQLEWAVADAAENLEKRQAELLNIQALTALLQHSSQIQATTDAERDRNRLLEELRNAEAALATDFDGFTYRAQITEAAIAVERRTADLQAAQTALAALRQPSTTTNTFDRHNYQNAINTAQSAYTRSIEDYDAAYQQYWNAWQELYILLWLGAPQEEVAMAESNINAAAIRRTTARRTREDARTGLTQANQAMTRAQNAFNTNNQEILGQAIAEAEAQLKQAENNLADAIRIYENATYALNRAETTATYAAQTRVDAALEALEENAHTAHTTLSTAEINLTNAYQQLERAETNLYLAQQALGLQNNNARRALELDLQQSDLQISNANLDLRAAEAALAAAISSCAGNISARGEGIILSINIREGQLVSRGDIIATVGVTTGNFTLNFSSTVSEAGFIEIGDEAIILRGGQNTNITAAVSDIRPQGEALTIHLAAETNELSGGEYVRVRIRKTSTHQTLVPNHAIFAGAMGQHYVWAIQSRPGTLGTEYFSTRVHVTIYASDSSNSAISGGLEMLWGAPIITSYNRPLTVNGRVGRLE